MPPIVALHKALYRLSKASQYFEEFLFKELLKLEFFRTVSDQQLFVLRKDGAIYYLSTHVDDLFVACSKLYDWVREQLSHVLQLTHRPESSIHLGLVLTRDRSLKSLTISQTAYIDAMSERFGVTSAHSEIESPMSSQFLPLLEQFSADAVSDNLINLFQQMVGCLQHLASHTRPDFKFSVNQLSRRAKCPTSRDYKAVRRLLFYADQT